MVVQSFDTIEEMLASMEKDRVAADALTQPWQESLAPGDFFLRVAQEVPIFCEVLDPGAVSPGATEDERQDAQEAAAWYQDPAMRGYRFCRAFSRYCPQGELGDVHVSMATLKVDKETFDRAKAANWKLKIRQG